jgi:pyruvate formate lyase activating enzyme
MIREAMLWRRIEDGIAACDLCAHRCRIRPGAFGVCRVRENREGTLVTHAYGEVIAAHVDPIEKKPFHHFLPGTAAFSIATAGCNFHCGFCQNWEISQIPKDGGSVLRGRELAPAEIVRAARESGCRSISYTYTEPTIFFEYAADTAVLARAAGLANTFVTNGFMTAEALDAARPWLDAANVDLKAFRDTTYKRICGGRLEPVLETIRRMREAGIWVEVTTLVVPGLNDGEEELGGIAAFLAGVDVDIPWHINRFHPDFEYTDSRPTPAATLERAARIGTEAGLRYVYIGNVAGEAEVTSCPGCRKPVIGRQGFRVVFNRVADGRCPECGTPIAGVF